MKPSLRLQLDQFFSYCDDEWLTPEDAAYKWDVDIEWARRALNQMVTEGKLERFSVPSPKINRPMVAYRRVNIPALMEARGLV